VPSVNVPGMRHDLGVKMTQHQAQQDVSALFLNFFQNWHSHIYSITIRGAGLLATPVLMDIQSLRAISM
jgi:hypothetical protein